MTRPVKNALVIGSLLGLGSLAAAKSPELDISRPDVEVIVYVHDYARVPERFLERAQAIAGHVFRHAGIEMVWVPVPVDGEACEEFSGYKLPAGATVVHLRIVLKPTARFARQHDVFGYAVGDLATVYYERVDRMACTLRSATDGIFASDLSPRVCASLLLGVVAAHELGHLLLGSNAHCGEGIMQPSWSRDDLEDALFGRQGFTPRQIERLRSTLQSLPATVIATSPPR